MLDDMDKQIVRLLQKNARTPNTEIARSLGVTETTIRNRVNRLVEENLIEIVAVVNPSATDATISAIIHVRVQPRHLQGVATALRGHGEVRYLALTLGEHQIVIEAFFRDHHHMLSFETDVLGELGGVTGAETAIVVQVDKLSYEWEI